VGVGVVFLIFLPGRELSAAPGVLRRPVRLLDLHLLPHPYALVGEPIHRREILPRPVVAAIVFLFRRRPRLGHRFLRRAGHGLTRINFSAGEIGGALGIAGSLGLLGLVLHFFGVLQERLRESVERLKEAEFAEKELELARSIQQRLLRPARSRRRATACRPAICRPASSPGISTTSSTWPDGHWASSSRTSREGIGASLIMASVKAVVPLWWRRTGQPRKP
jgi:hypothetical protein